MKRMPTGRRIASVDTYSDRIRVQFSSKGKVDSVGILGKLAITKDVYTTHQDAVMGNEQSGENVP